MSKFIDFLSAGPNESERAADIQLASDAPKSGDKLGPLDKSSLTYGGMFLLSGVASQIIKQIDKQVTNVALEPLIYCGIVAIVAMAFIFAVDFRVHRKSYKKPGSLLSSIGLAVANAIVLYASLIGIQTFG